MNFFLHLPEIHAQHALSLILVERTAYLGAAAWASNEHIQSEYTAAKALVFASLLAL